MSNQIITHKSEVLFLYESTYSIPNGDPFTGEQRYDEETKKVLVSDVRIKRFIRDYLEAEGEHIYVSDKTGAGKTNSAGVIKHMYEHTFNKEIDDVEKILKQCIDVRMFGGIATLKDTDAKINKNVKLKKSHTNLTGAVQFALLNPSLNRVNLRMHQNTTHFTSKEENQQGSIGTTTIVPYALIQIHGWINPKSATKTELSDGDVLKMHQALWQSVNDINTRSKNNQNSILLIEIVYSKPNQKIYGVDRLIKIDSDSKKKLEEEIRSMDDYKLNLNNLLQVAENDKVKEIKYYTEVEAIAETLAGHSKFKELEFNYD